MSSKDSYEEVMSERPSYRWDNKEYLVEVMMKQLGITEADLENDPSWKIPFAIKCIGKLKFVK